jgi:HD superfamily phosphohydrolase
MAMDLFNLFRTRMQLHSTLYQHHVVNVVEEMITDALAAAAGRERDAERVRI